MTGDVYLTARLMEACGCVVWAAQDIDDRWYPTRFMTCAEHADVMREASTRRFRERLSFQPTPEARL
jgi:hypothetical protein